MVEILSSQVPLIYEISVLIVSVTRGLYLSLFSSALYLWYCFFKFHAMFSPTLMIVGVGVVVSLWIYSYLFNQCLSPLKLWVQILIMTRYTRYNIMWQSLSVTCGRSVVFSGYPGFLHQKHWQPRYNWYFVESDVELTRTLNN
jgi:hypothetical protein